MASLQEPEVQFAQRLASNEKPIRTKAIKKLRKYINVRSQREEGGFSGDDVLKLWKGLFYCLWMQDKPQLQGELSNQISSLIHSFHHVDGQFLYLESFLQTFKREWTGIDRLRMDKFFQLVRFMFRQTFEMLKKKNWDSSVVSRFLELLKTQILQSGSGAPNGLQFHILDLYLTELAAVGSAELTADQNLILIGPFCKTSAKTKDRSLFAAICNSIFSTIIDQAPFAIDDLMKEVKAAHDSDSDSGQASDEEEEEEEITKRKPVSKKKQINGKKSNDIEDEDEEEEEEEEEEDELLHLEESDTDEPGDEDIGPVLQFDYTALADKLFQLASRSSTPSPNRQRLYKIIKVLRDLSEGVFPQDEYPEEVSTDEDDDDFGSRRRMKRRRVEGEEEAPAAKKKKGKKKEAPKAEQQNKDAGQVDAEEAKVTANGDNKKKKRKRKKKKKKAVQEGSAGDEAKTTEEGETGVSASEEGGKEEEMDAQSSVSSVQVTQTTDGQSETLLLSEVKKQPSVIVSEETSQPDLEDQSAQSTKSQNSEEAEEQQVQSTEAEIPSEADAAVSEKTKKKKKKKKNKKGLKSQSNEAGDEKETPETDSKAEKETDLKPEEDVKEADAESQVNGASAEVDLSAASSDSAGNETIDLTTPAKRRGKKKKVADEEEEKVEVAAEEEPAEILSQDETAKKKTKKRSKLEEAAAAAAEAAHESCVTPLKKKRKNVQKDSEAVEEEQGAETAQVANAEKPPCETLTKKKKTAKQPAAPVDDIKDPSQVADSGDEELPLTESASSGKAAKKKKRKIPVVFEFEADEVEAAASINGLGLQEENGGSDAEEQSTPLTSKKSQRMKKISSESDFITFQSNAAFPTPLFCKTKAGAVTPLSGKKKKKTQTPKSESKKVTFGLKNNKTAEFRKTDRSLLLSPDGSSRVPFDPEQKPKCGVLKSPPTPLSSKVKKTPAKIKKTPAKTKKTPTSIKKTPAGVKKTPTSTDAPKSTPRRRPSAADFF